jgi:hypothetical protein
MILSLCRKVQGLMNNRPVCSLCNEAVEIETAKTDADGKAIHEECYLAGLSKQTSRDRRRITDEKEKKIPPPNITSELGFGPFTPGP